jgi:hypothetical protein
MRLLEACAPHHDLAIKNQKNKIISHKQSQKTDSRELLSIFPNRLPTFTSVGTVGLMKTSQTLILLRQHRCLSLVSARLPS